MSGSMRFGSVCSGIEAASVAWHPLGWKAAWLSEIEKFPCAVLAHHYPDVPNLGDMTTLPNRIRSGEVEAPDVFCGGTPCQAFSVAGLRKSLDDARGNLSLTFCEIADAIDQVRLIQQSHPSIVFWENVPGVLNTKDNAFGCFLGALAGEDDALIPPGGRWSNAGFIDGSQRAVAWRVLDAQYFGVAQRRRRVFVVASARNDFDPAAVLFEFEGVRRDSAPRREKRQSVAASVRSSTQSGFDCGVELTGPLQARDYKDAGTDGMSKNSAKMIPVTKAFYESSLAQYKEADLAGTAKASGGVAGGGSETFIAQPIPLNTMTMQGRPSDDGRMGSGIGEPGDPVPTLTKAHSHAVAQPIGTDLYNGAITGDVAATIGTPGSSSNASGPTVMQPFQQTADCLTAAYGTKWNGNASADNGSLFVKQAMAVRRLTPVECERLQGFPDNYTKIADKTPDGPRYKALGNSWAVPVVRWIGERIARAT